MAIAKGYDYPGLVVALLEVIEKHGIVSLLDESDVRALSDARSIKRRRAASGDPIDYVWFKDTWNELCSPLPSLVQVNDKRRKAIRGLIEDFGGDQQAAKDAFVYAVKEVAADPWWQGQNDGKVRYGFDNLVPNKVAQKAESAIAKAAEVARTLRDDVPNSEQGDFKVGDDVLALGILTGRIEKAEMSKHGVGMLYTVRAFDEDVSRERVYDDKTVEWRGDELEHWTGR